MSRIVYFNGAYVPEREARISIYDSALTLGDMAFEVTRTYHLRPYRLRDHLTRLYHSLEIMQIDPGVSADDLESITLETLRRNLQGTDAQIDWNIIHNVSRGPASGFAEAFAPEEHRPTVVVSCYPLLTKMAALAATYEHGLQVVIPPQHAIPTSLLDASIKTRSRLHYQLANLQAAAMLPGASAVLTDPDGYLTEGTSGNVFIVSGGQLLTPAARNLLPGITRGVVMQLAQSLNIPCSEADITCEAASRAEEMFMTSTSIGVLHVRSFQGQTVGSGDAGSVTVRLRDALCTEVGLNFTEQAHQYADRLAAQQLSPGAS